jgi:hypothetical protein
MGHRLIPRLGFAALVALSTASACAAEPAAAELVDMFTAVCLGRFPDDAAVREFATENRLGVMPAEMVHQLLGTDPGEGWIRNTALGRYLLTVEMPPYHTCAIRKRDRAALDFLANLSEVLTVWAAKQRLASLKQQPVQTLRVGGVGGSPSQVYEWDLDRGPGKQAETLLAIVTNEVSGVSVRLARVIKVQ